MHPDRQRVQSWLEHETKGLLKTAESFAAQDLTQPSSLPGWSLGHLLSHVARNADALGNLLRWARTGIESPMYGSPAERDAAIARGATRPPVAIVSDVRDTCSAFALASQALSDDNWHQQVRTAQGRIVSAAEVPWLRLREVVIHHVDLGARFEDVPQEITAALFGEVLTMRSAKPGWPSMAITSLDSGFATADAGTAVARIEGSSAQLLGWLTGRSSGADLLVRSGALPSLPPWL